jgi:hypothetical protein
MAPLPPKQELVFQRSHMPGAEHETFQDQMRDQIRRAPWFMISVIFHALLLLILDNIEWSRTNVNEQLAIQADALPEDIEVLEEPPPPDEPEEPEEIEEIIEDPVVSEEEVEMMEEEDTRAPVDSPFDSRMTNDVIGVGGGAGGGFGGKYGRRGSGKGGGSASQKAVEAGLEWLRNHQHPSGYWDCDDFSNQCKTNICDGKGGALHDVGVSSIALLAFLGAGHTMNTGKYRKVVQKGLKYLVTNQDREDGCFASKSGNQFLYDHSLATLAVIEGYHLSRVPTLKGPAQKALDFIGRSRNPYKAWRYDYPPAGDNDVSVSGWMLFALFAGRDAGLTVDEQAIKDGMAFLDEMTDTTTWRTGYRTRGSPPAREEGDTEDWPPEESESMTAVSLMLRFFNKEDPTTSDAMKGGADLLDAKRPNWNEENGTIDFYYWYYGSYAMWQMSGRYWNNWQKKMLDAVVQTQRQDGDEKGSWDPQVDPWGDTGGRVYATAINTLCLEVYYRYDKLFGAR